MAATSQEIADLAGVSRGTVDRVLHNRGRVNPEVAARILKIAEDLEYQSIKRKKRKIRLGMILQLAETPMIQIAASGAREIAQKLQKYGVQVELREIHGRNTTQVLRHIDDLLEWNIHGLAIASDNTPELTRRMNMLHKRRVPVVTFNTDYPDSHRLCFIGTDNYRAGQTAAGLVRQILPSGGSVLPIDAHINNDSPQCRMRGFLDELKLKYSGGIKLLPVRPCFDENDYSHDLTLHALREYPSLECIYVASNGQKGVCCAIEEAGLKGRIRVIAHDLTETNRQLLRGEDLSFVLDQMAYEQGSRPLQILYDYLRYDILPGGSLLHMDTLIYTKYNIGNII